MRTFADLGTRSAVKRVRAGTKNILHTGELKIHQNCSKIDTTMKISLVKTGTTTLVNEQ